MQMKLDYLSIDKITPYEKNARKHQDFDVDAIIKSIKEFGFNDPIGVWGKKNIIVEGHGRLQAAKKLGMKEVPVIHLDDLTDEQRRAYTLAHNKTAELSMWDFEKLDEELSNILDIDMSDFGFDLSSVIDEDVDGDYEDEAPDDFKSYDENEETTHKCPRCGYEWR